MDSQGFQGPTGPFGGPQGFAEGRKSQDHQLLAAVGMAGLAGNNWKSKDSGAPASGISGCKQGCLEHTGESGNQEFQRGVGCGTTGSQDSTGNQEAGNWGNQVQGQVVDRPGSQDSWDGEIGTAGSQDSGNQGSGDGRIERNSRKYQVEIREIQDYRNPGITQESGVFQGWQVRDELAWRIPGSAGHIVVGAPRLGFA